MTSSDGKTWCIASNKSSEMELQNALDWACGPGNVDCTAIQPSQPCFEPDSLVPHASYAFNSFYQQNGATSAACDFGGRALKLIKTQGSLPPMQLAAMVAQTNIIPEDEPWYADSGSNNHITTSLNNISLQQPYAGNDNVIVGNGSDLTIAHTTSSLIQTPSSQLHLNNVLHCPSAFAIYSLFRDFVPIMTVILS
ncbi:PLASMODESMATA CALLOSE-BINDING PROTEIN 1-like [Juglans microcarpa x Juglans regia]|uniref:PLASMODESMATA CALLOSE-BINDING PROTEIN 1-like n=1 Tax=Juglans microcarpa x Juglans regia TaxID=2249226 RepID=UPI001B7E3493|nr:PLASMODESMATA CALLOSE-BINDING PROTEIN 1-like [Juglans microcarpa x Juglans regia]